MPPVRLNVGWSPKSDTSIPFTAIFSDTEAHADTLAAQLQSLRLGGTGVSASIHLPVDFTPGDGVANDTTLLLKIRATDGRIFRVKVPHFDKTKSPFACYTALVTAGLLAPNGSTPNALVEANLEAVVNVV